MPKKEKSVAKSTDKQAFIKGMSLNDFSGSLAMPSVVDVIQGKIARIKPLDYAWKYNKKEFNPWKITARGQVFEPGTKVLLPPFYLA